MTEQEKAELIQLANSAEGVGITVYSIMEHLQMRIEARKDINYRKALYKLRRGTDGMEVTHEWVMKNLAKITKIADENI